MLRNLFLTSFYAVPKQYLTESQKRLRKCKYNITDDGPSHVADSILSNNKNRLKM